MNVGILRFVERYFLYVISTILLAVAATLLFTQQVSAATAINKNVNDSAISYSSFVAFKGCVEYRLKDDIKTEPSNPQKTDPSTWFGNDITGGTAYTYPGAKKTECEDVIRNVSSIWGIADYGDLLKKIGYTFNTSIPEYRFSKSSQDRREGFVNYIGAKKVNGSSVSVLTGPAEYAIYLNGLETDCKGQIVPSNSTYKSWIGKTDGDYTYSTVKTPTGEVIYKHLRSGSFSLAGWGASNYSIGGSIRSVSCSDMVKKVNSLVAAYSLELYKDLCRTTGPKYTKLDEVAACADGKANQYAGPEYCTNKYPVRVIDNLSPTAPSTDSGIGKRDACLVGQGNGGAIECIAIGYTSGNTLKACTAGTKNKDNENYCTSTYPISDNLNPSNPRSNGSNQALQEACEEGRDLNILPSIESPSASTLTPCDPATNGCETETTCAVDGIGWIVCPVAEALSSATDALYGWITSYLKVPFINTDTADDANTLYKAWANMRNIANVAFVIVFLIIIFSQLTGTGVSNYGVKKMLPRLMISAILVNISYWIAAIAVDISNIAGSSLYTIIRGMNIGEVTISSNGWEVFLGWVLAGAAGATVTFGAIALAPVLSTFWPALLWGAIAFVLAAVLALVVAFAVLAARQALIVILIVLSPLAFIAFILPNTEKLFSMWRKSLTTLLIFYPLFAILFGSSYIASMVIIGSAGGGDSSSPAVGMTVLLGLAVQALPLFLTPMIIKFSTGIMGTVAGMVNNKSKGFIDRAKNTRNRKAKLAFHEGMQRNPQSKNPFSRAYRRTMYSAKEDQLRQESIDNRTNVGFLETERAKSLMHDKQLSSEMVNNSNELVKVEYEESLSAATNLPNDPQKRDAILAAQKVREEADIMRVRSGSTQGVLKQEFATKLANDTAMQTEAAGIDGVYGPSRVVAAAQAEISKARANAINDEASMLGSATPSQLFNTLQTSSSIEQRAAAIGKIFESGGDADIEAALDWVGSGQTGLSTADLEIVQSHAATKLGARKPSGLGQGDMSDLGRGLYGAGGAKTVQQGTLERIVGGKISGTSLFSATTDDLRRTQKAIEDGVLSGTFKTGDPQLLEIKKQIIEYKNNPSSAKPAKEILDYINKIESIIK